MKCELFARTLHASTVVVLSECFSAEWHRAAAVVALKMTTFTHRYPETTEPWDSFHQHDSSLPLKVSIPCVGAILLYTPDYTCRDKGGHRGIPEFE